MAAQSSHFNTTEEDFVFASVREFVKTWASGKPSKLELECKNGRLWLQLGFQFNQPSSLHSFSDFASLRRQKGKKQRNRDWERAQKFRAAHKKSSCQSSKTIEKNQNGPDLAEDQDQCQALCDASETPINELN